MDCDICDGPMVVKEATIARPYHYTLSGLKNAYLAGIEIRECPKCKIESPIIPRIAGLHDLIQKILVSKPALLTGDEIRFLRKNAGFSAKEFAEIIDETPSHLSRVERGKTSSLGAQADKLVRAIATVASDHQAKDHQGTRDVLLQSVC